MGARFDIQHINFVAYVTSETKRNAPRSDERTLWEFLFSMSDQYELRRRTISSNPTWQDNLRAQAARLVGRLNPNGDRLMSADEVASVLDPLRNFFTGYALYALIVPGDDMAQEERLTSTYERYVNRSAVDILVLMPYGGGSFVNVVDPFPVLQALATRPIQPPAVVFWTKSDDAIALSLSEADSFFEDHVSKGVKGGPRRSVRGLGNRIRAESKRLAAKTILHISDLHFGDELADRRKNYLKQHLRRIAPAADRIVISGDLFDQPDVKLKEVFDEFYADLTSYSKKAPILIPGNHDVRAKGNQIAGFGRNAEQFIEIDFQPVVVDDDLKVIFFCFNSCEDGNFATGYISDSQRRSRGSTFEKLLVERPAVATYERVAVVHHHPYKYETEPTVFYEKILNLISRREDRFVAFRNADEFLTWCGARDISLVLHGHKHVPHVIRANITIRDKPKEILIVGCGSTTGVENKPMCYDVISFDSHAKKWAVTFYSDPTGDGAGFDAQNVTLDLRTELPGP